MEFDRAVLALLGWLGRGRQCHSRSCATCLWENTQLGLRPLLHQRRNQRFIAKQICMTLVKRFRLVRVAQHEVAHG